MTYTVTDGRVRADRARYAGGLYIRREAAARGPVARRRYQVGDRCGGLLHRCRTRHRRRQGGRKTMRLRSELGGDREFDAVQQDVGLQDVVGIGVLDVPGERSLGGAD